MLIHIYIYKCIHVYTRIHIHIYIYIYIVLFILVVCVCHICYLVWIVLLGAVHDGLDLLSCAVLAKVSLPVGTSS